MTARELAARVRAGELSAREAVEQALARAEETAELGAFWSVDAEGAVAAAARVRGGRLAGVPAAVKDSFANDAPAVQRLRAEGAVVIGKTAMHELCVGMTGQCRGRALVRNPRAPGCHPGGSSSGSAVAVAAGIVPVALGSDSGGSIRVPAAWCGVAGFKGRRDAIPREGVLPLAPTFDTVGVLAATADDCRLVDAVLRGAAEEEPRDAAGLRVGVVGDVGALEATADDCRLVDAVLRGAPEEEPRDAAGLRVGVVGALEATGVDVVEVELPGRVPVGTLYAAEFAAAWDGALGDDVGDDVRELVEAGRRVTAVEYLRALEEVRRARRETRLDVDVVATPAVPVPPPPLDAPDDVRLFGRFARPFNVLDWPALVLPSGLQLAGEERALWALAAALEAVYA